MSVGQLKISMVARKHVSPTTRPEATDGASLGPAALHQRAVRDAQRDRERRGKFLHPPLAGSREVDFIFESTSTGPQMDRKVTPH